MELNREQDELMLRIGDDLFADTFSDDSVYTFFGQELKISQVFSANLGVAAPVWDAALHLCRYFEENSLNFEGKRIIELGAGTGLVGILAARLGANVTLTDLPLAVSQLQSNLSANVPSLGWPSVAPSVLPLSWGQDQENFPTNWDLVLGADIVYLAETYPLLVDTLAHLCQDGATLYLSSKMRGEHGTPGFYRDTLPQRFRVELVHRDPTQNIHIYRAVLKGKQ